MALHSNHMGGEPQGSFALAQKQYEDEVGPLEIEDLLGPDEGYMGEEYMTSEDEGLTQPYGDQMGPMPMGGMGGGMPMGMASGAGPTSNPMGGEYAQGGPGGPTANVSPHGGDPSEMGDDTMSDQTKNDMRNLLTERAQKRAKLAEKFQMQAYSLNKNVPGY